MNQRMKIFKQISMKADNDDFIDEGNEMNNEKEEIWNCDNTPPIIIYGPVVEEVTTDSATIYWMTDEETTGMVYFSDTGSDWFTANDPTFSTEHRIELDYLSPSGSTFLYHVESMDMSINKVKSRNASFELRHLSDNIKPTMAVSIPETLLALSTISVDASDNLAIDKVIFSCDNNEVYTDYSDPYTWDYYTGNMHDGVHNFGFKGVDQAGNSVVESEQCTIDNQRPPDECPLYINIIEPEDGGTAYISHWLPLTACIESEIGTCIEKVEVLWDDTVVCQREFECYEWNDIVIHPFIGSTIDQEKIMIWHPTWFGWITHSFIPISIFK